METLLRIGLSNAIGAAVLALLAFGVSRSVRRPALSHVLWVLVLAKLLAPPIRNIPIHLLEPRAPAPASSPDAFVLRPQAGPVNGLIAQLNPKKRFSVETVIQAALVLWIGGSATYAVIAVMRLRRFGAILQYALPADDGIQARVAQLAGQIGLRRVPPAWVLPGPVCPMLWAVLARPRLLLPAELWRKLSARQQATLIVHELAHLKRRDHWVRIVEMLATAAYWWNPVLWWSRGELREAEEQCCDAWVNAVMPEQTDHYAAALLEAVDFVSSFPCESRPVLPALASGIGQFRHLQQRLIMIQQGTSRTNLGPAGVLWVGIAMILSSLSLSCAQRSSRAQLATPVAHPGAPATQPTGETKPDPREAALLNRMLPELSFDAVGFSDVIDFLRDVTGANIVVDWKRMEQAGIQRNTPVIVRLQGVKFSTALDAIFQNAGNGKVRPAYFYLNGGLTITTAHGS